MAEQKIQVLSRAFLIIEFLSEHQAGAGITRISQEVGLNKSTVFRIVNALLSMGYITKNEENEQYALSMKFVQLSSMMLNQTELKVVAYPFLKRLAAQTLQTVHLCILRGNEAIYMDKVEAFNHNIHMYSAIGSAIPLYSTGVGKCLLAWMPENEQIPILDTLQFQPKTCFTIQNKQALQQELIRTRERGYAVDDMENEVGIRCAAAPLRDFSGKVIAAISVSGEYASVESKEFQFAVENIQSAAARISAEMGYWRTPPVCHPAR